MHTNSVTIKRTTALDAVCCMLQVWTGIIHSYNITTYSTPFVDLQSSREELITDVDELKKKISGTE